MSNTNKFGGELELAFDFSNGGFGAERESARSSGSFFAEVVDVVKQRTSGAGRVTGQTGVAVVLADVANGVGDVGQFASDRVAEAVQAHQQTQDQHRGDEDQFRRNDETGLVSDKLLQHENSLTFCVMCTDMIGS